MTDRDSGGGISADTEARQLRWRCRRGLKELDVLLDRYASARLPSASPGERGALARLLDEPDPRLAEYLLGGVRPADPELAALIQLILGIGGNSRPDWA